MSHYLDLASPPARLLAANAQWSADVQNAIPDFFKQSAAGQSPHTLWIGCADSRVPESVITGARPGEIFVHRNIANQVSLDDESMLSVLAYAIDFLGVEHVIIVGHTECGGASACLDAARSPSFHPDKPVVTIPSLPVTAPLNQWLAPLTVLAASLELSSAPKEEVLPILVDENVKAQVEKMCQTSTIINAWANKSAKGKDVWVHGWVYDLSEGLLRDLHFTKGPKFR